MTKQGEKKTKKTKKDEKATKKPKGFQKKQAPALIQHKLTCVAALSRPVSEYLN